MLSTFSEKKSAPQKKVLATPMSGNIYWRAMDAGYINKNTPHSEHLTMFVFIFCYTTWNMKQNQENNLQKSTVRITLQHLQQFTFTDLTNSQNSSPTWITGLLVTGLLQFSSMKQNEIFWICDTINKLLPKPIYNSHKQSGFMLFI